MSDPFAPGAAVRLKSNPARKGRLTGARVDHRGHVRLEVDFGDGCEFVPALALEPVTTESERPFALLSNLRFVGARALRSAITHCRLSGRIADMIYSLNTTNTDFYAYQFKPVLSFLDSPSRGLLIADEVGLGKTIEAGLIWTELRSRDAARRLLVLCPAMLREKWRRELLLRFGVSAQIVNASEALAVLAEAPESGGGEFALIASLQGLRPPAGWDDDREKANGAAVLARFLSEQGEERTLFDLVIIDEAHYLRNPETQTARLGQLLRPAAENMVLLSATPIQLRSADLFNLLNLLDRDTFPFEGAFDTLLNEAAPLVRIRDHLLSEKPLTIDEYSAALGTVARSRSLSGSEILRALIAAPPGEAELASVPRRVELATLLDKCNPVGKVVSRTRKRDVHERRVIRDAHALAVTMNEVERDFYAAVTDRVRSYAARLDAAEGFLVTIPQRQMCSSMPAAFREWTTGGSELEEEIDELIWETFGDEAANSVRQPKPLMRELAGIARSCTDFESLKRSDSKFSALWNTLTSYWRKFPDAKVVLFAYFRGTLRYLAERFAEEGVDTALLMGGMDKDAILASFAAPDGPRLLLSSEVASEGVDLQFSSVVVNYDLPWNPMRIEQRIGRIDRIGQRAERILIWNVFLADSLDDRVYRRLLERLDVFERALGTTEALLGAAIRRMTDSLLRHHLSAEEEAQLIDQTSIAVQANLSLQEKLESEATRLMAHGDYLQARIDAAKHLHRFVGSEDVYSYVRDFLETHYEGAHLVGAGDGSNDWLVDLGAKGRARFSRFLEVERMQGRTRLGAEGAGRVRCRFENRLTKSVPDVEVISQYHPLVSWVSRELRADEKTRQAPIVAVEVDAEVAEGVPNGTYAFAVQRWSFSAERSVERLVFAARELSGTAIAMAPDVAERLITRAALGGRNWVDAKGLLEPELVADSFVDSLDELDRRFDEFDRYARLEATDRIRFQIQLQDRHEEHEVARLQALIAEMRLQGKSRGVSLNESKLRKLRERVEDRRARLRDRLEQMGSESRLAAGGVIKVS